MPRRSCRAMPRCTSTSATFSPSGETPIARSRSTAWRSLSIRSRRTRPSCARRSPSSKSSSRRSRLHAEMRRALVVLLLCAIVAGCRTARPAGEETPLNPLTSVSADDAARQLAERRAQMTSQRSLLMIRATTAGHSLSLRAQLQIDNGGRMLLTAYTPFGTNAIRLYAEGSEVTFVNDIEGTWWHGGVAEFGRSFGFFGSASPSSIGLLLMGLPAARPDLTYEYAAAGRKRSD